MGNHLGGGRVGLTRHRRGSPKSVGTKSHDPVQRTEQGLSWLGPSPGRQRRARPLVPQASKSKSKNLSQANTRPIPGAVKSGSSTQRCGPKEKNFSLPPRKGEQNAPQDGATPEALREVQAKEASENVKRPRKPSGGDTKGRVTPKRSSRANRREEKAVRKGGREENQAKQVHQGTGQVPAL